MDALPALGFVRPHNIRMEQPCVRARRNDVEQLPILDYWQYAVVQQRSGRIGDDRDIVVGANNRPADPFDDFEAPISPGCTCMKDVLNTCGTMFCWPICCPTRSNRRAPIPGVRRSAGWASEGMRLGPLHWEIVDDQSLVGHCGDRAVVLHSILLPAGSVRCPWCGVEEIRPKLSELNGSIRTQLQRLPIR